MPRPAGTFVREEYCVCGFMVDEYDGRYSIEYADPETGMVLTRCPECRRDLDLRGQGRGAAATNHNERGPDA